MIHYRISADGGWIGNVDYAVKQLVLRVIRAHPGCLLTRDLAVYCGIHPDLAAACVYELRVFDGFREIKPQSFLAVWD